MADYQLYQGDCLEILPTLVAESVDADGPGQAKGDGGERIGRLAPDARRYDLLGLYKQLPAGERSSLRLLLGALRPRTLAAMQNDLHGYEENGNPIFSLLYSLTVEQLEKDAGYAQAHILMNEAVN